MTEETASGQVHYGSGPSAPVEHASAAAPEPAPDPETGIGPGSELWISVANANDSGCTANFLWTDQDDRLYLGTAGHCVLRDGHVGTHGPNATFDPSRVTVEVAPEGCTLEPSTFAVGVETCLTRDQEYVELGPLVFARDSKGEVVTDVALVCVPDARVEQARASLPSWGGPTGLGHMEQGDRVLLYGHALGFDATPTTERRMGTGLRVDEHGWFDASAPVWQGDSGAAVVLADPESPITDLEGAGALGIATEIRASVSGGVHPAPVAGPTVHNVVDAARELAGLELNLVTEDPDPSEVDGCPSSEPVDTPTVERDGARLEVGLPEGGPYVFTLEVEDRTDLTDLSTAVGGPTHAAVALRPQAASLDVDTCRDLPEAWAAGIVVDANASAGPLPVSSERAGVHGNLEPGTYEVTLAPSGPGNVTVELSNATATPVGPPQPLARAVGVELADVERSAVTTEAARVDESVPAAADDLLLISIFEPRPALAAGSYEARASLSTDAATCSLDEDADERTVSSHGSFVNAPRALSSAAVVPAGTPAGFSASFEADATVWTPGDPAGREAVAGYATVPLDGSG